MTGTWDATTANNTSNPPGNEEPDETVQITVTQTGSSVSIAWGGETRTGFVSGADYYVNDETSQAGGTLQRMIEFSLTSSDAGAGTIRWRFEDDTSNIAGTADLMLARP